MAKLLPVVLVAFLAPFHLLAQFESSPIQEQYSVLFKNYEEKLGLGAAIYQGPEYLPTDPSILGTPFFQQKNFSFGSVIYQGHIYNNLLLGYDVIQDNLVLAYQNRGQFFQIVLDRDKVDAFVLLGHTFDNRQPETAGLPFGGYLDKLYDGPSKILVKRNKKTRPSTTKGYLYEYVNADKYFVYTKGEFVPVNSKSKIFKIFKENRKLLRKQILKTDLDYRSQKDRYLQKVCQLNDQIEG